MLRFLSLLNWSLPVAFLVGGVAVTSAYYNPTPYSDTSAPCTVPTAPQPGYYSPISSYSSSNIYADYNQSLDPVWTTISRDMECRKFPNVACHDNAYPNWSDWSAFLQQFNQVINDANQANNPQLSQDVALTRNYLALIPHNPDNFNQAKISRDDYNQIKDGLQRIKQDLTYNTNYGY